MTPPTCKTCPWYYTPMGLCFGPRADGLDADVSIGEDAWCHHHPDRQPIPCVRCAGTGIASEIVDDVAYRTIAVRCPDCNGRGKHYPRFDEEGKAT